MNKQDKILGLSPSQRRLLLAAAAVSSSCGLATELLLGTLASYLVGNQALAYGVAVGGFLAAMGVGSYLSRYIAVNANDVLQRHQLLLTFLKIELLIAPLTALLPLALFALFVVDGSLWLGLFLVTVLLGILAGLEVPLLTRVLELETGVREALAGVLALDYLGALLGSLAFPVVLLPLLGLFPTAFILGVLPALMVFAIAQRFSKFRGWGYLGLATAALLCLLAPAAVPVSNALENTLYSAPVIARFQSPYQRIVLTRYGRDLRLFLDGDLQLSTLDEYRYHEALVHPAISASANQHRVLVMGAGDGMALREVLKWQEVEKVMLIELDPTVVKLALHHPQLARANEGAFADPRVEVIYADAFVAAPALQETFDVIIADFPDPDREIIAKLYSEGFYRRLLARLADGGVLVTQASSPFFAPDVLSCIVRTLTAAGRPRAAAPPLQGGVPMTEVGIFVHPYLVNVPSFGPWGFVLASHHPIDPSILKLLVPTRFLTEPLLQHLFELPKDVQIGKNVKVNRLGDPVIVRYQTNPRWSAY